ncbi:MAG: hypothetical protein OXJ62_09425, partial [Spirochaetaceae bacterium]|nr:hypothetical protein [Spirochaetaceae bacterium]
MHCGNAFGHSNRYARLPGEFRPAPYRFLDLAKNVESAPSLHGCVARASDEVVALEAVASAVQRHLVCAGPAPSRIVSGATCRPLGRKAGAYSNAAEPRPVNRRSTYLHIFIDLLLEIFVVIYQ